MNSLVLKIELLPTVDLLINLQDLKALHGIDVDKQIQLIKKFETTMNIYSSFYWEVLLNSKKINKRGLYT